MTPAETVRAFHEARERRDDAAFGHVAEDLIQHAAGPQGREGIRLTLATLEHDLERPTATIHRLVAQDDLVVVHLTLHGRHVASTMPLLAGLPPTGNVIAWDAEQEGAAALRHGRTRGSAAEQALDDPCVGE